MWQLSSLTGWKYSSVVVKSIFFLLKWLPCDIHYLMPLGDSYSLLRSIFLSAIYLTARDTQAKFKETMSESINEQRINIKFCIKLAESKWSLTNLESSSQLHHACYYTSKTYTHKINHFIIGIFVLYPISLCPFYILRSAMC